MLPDTIKAAPEDSFPAAWVEQGEKFDTRALTLIREGLLLNERAFDRVREHPRPARLGLSILGGITLLLVIGLVFGMLFDYLTVPQLDLVAAGLYERITGMAWFTQLAANNPEFAQRFGPAYDAAWQIIRALTGYPSFVGFGLALLGSLLPLFGGWLAFGVVGHILARWLGGRATLGQFLGVLALSYAPLVLRGLTAIPGFSLTVTLIPLLLVITRFIAVRRTYGLTTGYSLAVVFGPYFVGLVVSIVLLALVIGFGLGQIPYLDPILRLLRAWPSP